MKKKRYVSLFMLLFMMLIAGCNQKQTEEETKPMGAMVQDAQESKIVDEQKEDVSGFSISGTMLLDANGNEFVIRGINYPHAWYADNAEISIPAIAKTGANSVRVVCGSGSQYNVTRLAEIKNLCELAKKNKLVIILEAHDATGSNEIEDLRQITEYWLEQKEALQGTEDYCILNIANEWVGEWDGSLWCDGYVEAIQKLREAGIKNTIMIDSPGWGQYAEAIKDYGMSVFSADADRNTMFSVHMYGTAGKDAQTIEANIKAATEQGLCICVGEFGYLHGDGDVDEEYIMKYCMENNIGYLGWSWKGNSGGVEYLDIATEWDGSVLSAEWGEVLIHGEYGIEKTSKICSIYE